jgi:hypothetical protein
MWEGTILDPNGTTVTLDVYRYTEGCVLTLLGQFQIVLDEKKHDYEMDVGWVASGTLQPTDRLYFDLYSDGEGSEEAYWVTEELGATALRGTWLMHFMMHWYNGIDEEPDRMYFSCGSGDYDSKITNFDYAVFAPTVNLYHTVR